MIANGDSKPYPARSPVVGFAVPRTVHALFLMYLFTCPTYAVASLETWL